MKKFTGILLAMVLALGAVLLPAMAAAEIPIHFPDANFEAAVREEIGKPSGEIYPADVAGVTELEIDGRGISDLTGIKYFTSLQTLSCYNNNLSELDLSELTSLTYLYCYYSCN